MNRVAFIIPYIGKFPNYFQLWLNSCSYNKEFDWIIFTDDHTSYVYPNNVKVYYVSFCELKTMFQKKYDFPISLNAPYKICDYRPAYGEIFSDYIKDYEFWGYCDVDLIWGNLSKWITDTVLNKYERISKFGHCQIFRNTTEMNTLYKTFIPNKVSYKQVFIDLENYQFDEKPGINAICESLKIKTFHMPLYDMDTTKFAFTPTMYTQSFLDLKTRYNVFVFNKGNLLLFGLSKGHIVNREFAYLHLQKRPMKVEVVNSEGQFLILPNKFIAPQSIDEKLLKKVHSHSIIYVKGLKNSRFWRVVQIMFGTNKVKMHESRLQRLVDKLKH